MTKGIRTRIAPSPSSDHGLHVGNIRTAIYNYLIAKKTGGSFVYRLENTDLARNSDKGIAAIKESFEWLGIIPDEGYGGYGGDFGPYSQLERLHIYKQYAEKLIDEGKAYRCFCTQEDLDAERKILADQGKKDFKYSGRCRDRKDQPKDKDYVVRLKTSTEGYTEYNDLVFGTIKTPNKEMQDPVLIRSNGVCLYNWGCVIDDLTMNIGLVLRGRDHHVNSPQQLLMYDALGAKPPQFAHLPLMLSPDGKSKLSKRTAAVSVLEYRKMGYSPGSVISYLMKFGWGFGNQEIFTIDELIEKFSLDNCGKGDGRFDPRKFAAINNEHLKSPTLTPDTEYAKYLHPFVREGVSIEALIPLIPLIRTRAKTFIEAANELDPILQVNITVDETASTKFITNTSKSILKNLHTYLSNVETINTWNEQYLRAATSNWLAASNLTLKDIGQTLRIALTGKSSSPEVFAVMSALGKDVALNRINNLISH